MASLSNVTVAQALVDLQQGRFTSCHTYAHTYGSSKPPYAKPKFKRS